jgi:hypothetical protein
MFCEWVVKRQLLEKEHLSAIPQAIPSGIALATTEALAAAEALATAEAPATSEASSATADETEYCHNYSTDPFTIIVPTLSRPFHKIGC